MGVTDASYETEETWNLFEEVCSIAVQCTDDQQLLFAATAAYEANDLESLHEVIVRSNGLLYVDRGLRSLQGRGCSGKFSVQLPLNDEQIEALEGKRPIRSRMVGMMTP
jgi:hypothetical protein